MSMEDMMICDVCLNPAIKWHGHPRKIRVDSIKVEFKEMDGVTAVCVSAKPKKVTRKRYIKLMMAHGLPARKAREFAEIVRREIGDYKRGYGLSLGFINQQIKGAKRHT